MEYQAQMEDYDLVILGRDAGSKLLARTFAGSGKRVSITERKYVGESCPNIVRLPSKNNRRILILILFLSSIFPYVTFAQNHHHHGGEAVVPQSLAKVGTVSFPISCTASVRPQFERGVAMMHSFWYEEARAQFTAVAVADPHCAMAQWGLAMTE